LQPSVQPTSEPSALPSCQPSSEPTVSNSQRRLEIVPITAKENDNIVSEQSHDRSRHLRVINSSLMTDSPTIDKGSSLKSPDSEITPTETLNRNSKESLESKEKSSWWRIL